MIRQKASVCALVMGVLLGGCGGSTNPKSNTPGKHHQTLLVSGLSRQFIVYVPAKAQGPALAPVVIMNHGTSGDGERFYNISGWKEKADQEGLIAVFPTALVHCYHEDENRDGDFDDPGEQKVTTKWNAGQFDQNLPLCTAQEIAALPPDKRAMADHPLADDIPFFHGLLDFLAANYSVDTKRIYVSGFSNGGSMSSRLAVEMTHRFAAAASAASPLTISAQASLPIAFVLSYGNEDPALTVYNAGAPIPLQESSLLGPQINNFLVGRWLSALSLANTYTYSESQLSGQKVSRWRYATSTVGASNSLQVALIDRLDHQYPNGTNHSVVMANVLWEFFKTHQR